MLRFLYLAQIFLAASRKLVPLLLVREDTTPATDRIVRREVIRNRLISADELKRSLIPLLDKASIRNVQICDRISQALKFNFDLLPAQIFKNLWLTHNQATLID